MAWFITPADPKRQHQAKEYADTFASEFAPGKNGYAADKQTTTRRQKSACEWHLRFRDGYLEAAIPHFYLI
jgi:hypothetical protein